jgi:membrane-associated phospholipid phosphatase
LAEEGGGMETGRRVAKVYSALLTPFSVPAIESVVLSWLSPTGSGPVMSAGVSALLGILILSVVPFVPVVYGVRTRRTDLDISDRKERGFFYAISLVAYAVGVAVFCTTGNRIMFVLSVACFCVGSAMMLITFAWKISAHTAAIAGMATAFCLVLGTWMLLVYLLAALMIWTRVKLGAHTKLQALAGAIVSTAITAIVFVFLYI